MGFRKKKESRIVQQARIRQSGMEKIDELHEREVNYGGEGDPVTASTVDAEIQENERLVKDYNKTLEMADKLGNRIAASDDKLEALYSRVLKGAVAEFDADADEIEMLGGTRKSERKRPKGNGGSDEGDGAES